VTIRRGTYVRRIGDGLAGIVTYVGLRCVEVLWLDRQEPERAESIGLGVSALNDQDAYRLWLRAGRISLSNARR